MVPFRSRSSPGWQRAWENLTAPLPLYRNYSRYRTMAHWLRPRSLLRCSDSIQCSIRFGMIRASKNSPPRARRTMRSNEVPTRETKTLAVLSADGLVMAEAAFPHEVCPSPRKEQPAGLDRQGLHEVGPF